MNPMIKLVRTDHGDWEERRFFSAITVRTVTGSNALEQDTRYLQHHTHFPSVGAVTYAPYVELLS